jgi:hypothetical protein
MTPALFRRSSLKGARTWRFAYLAVRATLSLTRPAATRRFTAVHNDHVRPGGASDKRRQTINAGAWNKGEKPSVGAA